ncbi:hypothetical protein NC651_017545 [Populus alba x Populus x berolinensis]|nr:hypothetical protein NC651_017545 [Populus alba x Populus x berolinensis]
MRQQQEDYRPSIPDAAQEEAPLTFDNSVPTSDPMSIDQCQTIPEMEDSQLVGATVSMVTADVDSSKRESVHIVPAVEVSNHVRIAENSTGKRKRGRPPRTQGKLGPPQAPPASSSQRKKRDEEDVCFICFDGGSLVLCDRRGCPKAYHPACIKRDEAFFRSKAKWNCGWHICSSCQKASHYMCYTCPYSLCKGCTKDADYLCVRGNKGFCGTCMRTIMLIENIATVNQEKVQVDFDDTTSWEYLFKVYWIYLKAKLSLTIDELTKAKNPWKGDDLTKVKSPWKGAGAMAPKQDPSGEFCHSNDNNGSFSDSFCGNLEIHAKRRKMEDQPKLHIENSLVMEKSCTDQLTHPPDSTLWATKELLDFVSHLKNGDMSVLSPFEVQSLLLEYIKRNDLRDPHQKGHIFCDSRLIKLFGKERVGHFEMLKLLEYHFLVKEKSPVDETTVMGVSNAGGGQVEAAGNSDSQLVTGSDRRRKTRKKIDDRGPQINCNPEEYAAIDVHNISLLYLKRSLMENLMDDAGKFHEKVVGSFVRIKISGGDKKQDMYRLVQVVGIGKAAESYKVGTKTTDDMLEILNLDKKEVISIDGISDQDFSEVRDVRLIMDRNSRRSKGVGYVEFYDAMSVPMAITLSGQLLLGQPVMVKPSEAEKNLVQPSASGGGTGVFFEPFGIVDLVQLPLNLRDRTMQKFTQHENAKAAQSAFEGKLEIAVRTIKQDSGVKSADFDDDDGGGLALNAQSRALLMQKLDRTGTATGIAGSLGVPLLNGSAPNQQAISLPVNGQTNIGAAAFPALVLPSPAYESIGQPSECLLLKNMFDPATEVIMTSGRNSAGHVYLQVRQHGSSSKSSACNAYEMVARRSILAIFMPRLRGFEKPALNRTSRFPVHTLVTGTEILSLSHIGFNFWTGQPVNMKQDSKMELEGTGQDS